MALGQINFAIHNHHFSTEKLKNFYQKSDELKEGKEAKKLVSTNLGKQLSARFKNIKEPTLQKILNLANYQKDQQVLIRKINLKTRFEEFLAFNFTSINSAWFGCCGDRH